MRRNIVSYVCKLKWLRGFSPRDLGWIAAASAWLAFLLLAEPSGKLSWPFHFHFTSLDALVDKSILLMACMSASCRQTFLSRVGWLLGSIAAGIAGYWIEVPLYYIVLDIALMRHRYSSTILGTSSAPFFTAWVPVSVATDACRLLVAVIILRAAMEKLKAKEAVC